MVTLRPRQVSDRDLLWRVQTSIHCCSQSTTSFVIVSNPSLMVYYYDVDYYLPDAAEAAQIVVNNPIKTVMLPINVTHMAIVNPAIHARLCSSHDHDHDHDHHTLIPPETNLRKMLSSLVTFFGDTYREVFGFEDGPPLHDALTIAYVFNPALFKGRRLHVDVETRGEHTTGATIVDTWNYGKYDDTWGPNGKNCVVLESLEVSPRSVCYHDADNFLGRSVLRCPLGLHQSMR